MREFNTLYISNKPGMNKMLKFLIPLLLLCSGLLAQTENRSPQFNFWGKVKITGKNTHGGINTPGAILEIGDDVSPGFLRLPGNSNLGSIPAADRLLGYSNGRIYYNDGTQWRYLVHQQDLAAIGDSVYVRSAFNNGKLYLYRNFNFNNNDSLDFKSFYLPYYGALSNTDVGNFRLKASAFDLKTTNTQVDSIGRLRWNADDLTMNLGLTNSVVLQTGQEMLILVKNQTGSTIPNGTVVRQSGVVGASGRLKVEPFLANGQHNSNQVLGLTTEDIPSGGDGFVAYFGKVRGLNTAAYPDSTILYASPTVPGGFTSVIPEAPNNIVKIGTVINSSTNNGTIFARVVAGSNINQDEGVRLINPLNNSLLAYDSLTTLWKNKTLVEMGIVRVVDTAAMLSNYPRTTRFLDTTLALRTLINTKQNILTNPVTGTGTTNTIPKLTGTSTIGNSNISDNGSLVTIASSSYIGGTLGIGGTVSNNILRVGGLITGAAAVVAANHNGVIQSGVTSSASYNMTIASTQAATFTLGELYHYRSTQGTFGASSVVTNQYGFSAEASLTSATNNFGFYGNIPSGTNRWNLYMNGTAQNYIRGNLGIGIAVPLTNAHVRGSLGPGTQSPVLRLNDVSGSLFNGAAIDFSYSSAEIVNARIGALSVAGGGGALTFAVAASDGATPTEYARLTKAGRFLLGTTTDNGADILQTNGSNLLGGNARITGNTSIGAATSPAINLQINRTISGGSTAYNVVSQGAVQSDVTSLAAYYYSNALTQAATFTLTNLNHYMANQGPFGAGSTVTNQHGFLVNNTLTGATNNYGFRGQIPSGTGRWNLYMDGTANNYLNGNLGIGSLAIGSINLRLSRPLTGSTNVFAMYSDGIIQTDAINAGYFQTLATTAPSATIGVLQHYSAFQGSLGAGSTVTNQYGFTAEANIIGATGLNVGFWGRIPSGTGRWNLYMDGTANNYLAGKLGIGSTNLSVVNLRLANNLTGGTSTYGMYQEGTVLSDVTSSAYGYFNLARTQASAFTLGSYIHYGTSQSTLGAGSSVTTQVGFDAENSLTSATTNIGFRGRIPTGTGRWNLYMEGGANNYLNGRTLFGTTTDNGVDRLQVSGNAFINGTTLSIFNSYSNYRLTGISGGWDRRYGFFGSAGTDRGGFGAFGGTDILSYYYIGSTYLDYIARFEYATKGVLLEGTLGVNSTTASTSTTTGALRSAGGLGVAGAGNFGATVSANKYSNIGAGSFASGVSDGYLQVYASTTNGIVISGRGSTNDINIANNNAQQVITVPTGTQNVVFGGSGIFASGLTAQRGRFTSLVLNKDSIPITLSDFWVYTSDTTGTPGTNQTRRRNIGAVHTGTIAFDTSSRQLTVTYLNGNTNSVVIPRGTASGASGITSLSSSRLGNIITISGDNGSSTLISIRDADSASIVRFSDTASMLASRLKTSDTSTLMSNYRRTSTLIEQSEVNGLSSSLNSKLNISDTSGMLANRLRISDTLTMLSNYRRTSNLIQPSEVNSLVDWLGLKLNISDTSGMLANTLRISDTLNMLSNYRRTSTKILQGEVDGLISALGSKLKTSDTSTLMSNYRRTSTLIEQSEVNGLSSSLNSKLNISDTSGMLANRLRISDTLTMLSNRLKISDTSNLVAPYARLQIFTDSLAAVQARIQTKQPLGAYITLGDSSTILAGRWLPNRNTDSIAVIRALANSKLSISDTSGMLANRLKISDTLTMLSNRLKISDTLRMMSNYRRTSTKILNSDLVNSTISGISLGSSLNNISAGNGLVGTDYNGGTARVWRVDTSTVSTKANVTALLLGYTTTSANALKLNISDTSGMLANRLRISDTLTMLSNRLKISDTLTMLSNRLRISDTLRMMSNYRRTSTLIQQSEVNGLSVSLNSKLNISDTTLMLNGYYRTITATNALALKLNISDTSGMLVNRLRISDTLTMLSNRLRISDTSGMLANYRRTSTLIENNNLRNSTISGISLGGNLNSISAGNGLIGTSFNGSAAQLWRVDTSTISTKANVTGLLTGYLTTSGTAANSTLWNGKAYSDAGVSAPNISLAMVWDVSNNRFAQATQSQMRGWLGLGTMANENTANYYSNSQINNFFSGATGITGYNKTNWDNVFAWYNSGPLVGYATESWVSTNFYNKTQSDSRYLQSFTETDPTISSWAKASTKPSYTYAEIGGAVPTWNQNTTGNAATVTNGVYTTGSYNNPSWITGLAWSKISGAPAFLTSYTETDPTVPSYAKSLSSFASSIKPSTDALYEPLFSKNNAFNKNFGTSAGTVAEGNDSRILNGQTAYTWGNHAGLYLPITGGNVGAIGTPLVLINTTEDYGHKLQVGGIIAAKATNTIFLDPTGTNIGAFVSATGTMTTLNIQASGQPTIFWGNVTASGFFESSDARLKNIVKTDGDVVYFRWKDKKDEKLHIGYLAQEVQKTNPDQVKSDEKGNLAVNYTEILVQKVRELEKKVELLNKKLNSIKTKK